MSEFKLADFQRAQFRHREQQIPLPDLAGFFSGDPVWTARGLTAEELARVDESAEKLKNLAALAEGLVSPDKKAQAAAFREMFGVSENTPVTLNRQLDIFLLGSVRPVLDRPTAVKFADAYPIEFKIVIKTIMNLTAQGKQVGKPPGSGETRPSEPPSSSATRRTASSSRRGRTSSRKGT